MQEDAPSLVAQLLERLPPSDHPEAQEQELIARNIAGIAYIGVLVLYHLILGLTVPSDPWIAGADTVSDL